ncbi:Rpn family recombination-promoting nuclease/putative transposase [Stutzerimonas kirkiae]|uniref:Rpn family recombination-promoting nuclease/putative transposase n=1 Tax=Stutzerimonas kirkiae TaxID=2211392 RepID=UPI001A955DE9|nr:Rpn family recombination-promoting nuclease/putative transposase [Stutzerimonas kirkiae]
MPEQSQHKPHDNSYKLLFSNPQMVADLLRGYIHQPWVEQLDFTTLSRVASSHVSADLREREDDIIWRVRWADQQRWLYIYLLLQFQSRPDRYMALRILTYLGRLYEDLGKTRQLTPSGKLPPVLPIVLYNGRRRWHAAQRISPNSSTRHPATCRPTGRTCATSCWTKTAMPTNPYPRYATWSPPCSAWRTAVPRKTSANC